MAVQNHLLSNTILLHPDDIDDSDSSLQGETMKVQVNIPFKNPMVCVDWWRQLLHSWKMEQTGIKTIYCGLFCS